MQNIGQQTIIQPYFKAKHEVGISCEKDCITEEWRITDLGYRNLGVLNKKYGGRENVPDFIPGSCHNVRCEDGREWITEANSRVIIDICKKFGYIDKCRFDVLFNSIDEFKRGINFFIIEGEWSYGICIICFCKALV